MNERHRRHNRCPGRVDYDLRRRSPSLMSGAPEEEDGRSRARRPALCTAAARDGPASGSSRRKRGIRRCAAAFMPPSDQRPHASSVRRCAPLFSLANHGASPPPPTEPPLPLPLAPVPISGRGSRRWRSPPDPEKKALPEGKLKQEEKFMWAVVDGTREKVGTFRVEPPGLFRGRGEHPKMGKLKQRILPSDI
ncbi:hypothetical protein BRADI_2g60537v3 [Brachypodium distachyon]|uniref:DNA topoisomerase I DNA binding eukaryotic-type domain-containing protein n=1 Tax=Brachypodium distachyon TaxID=15368 RepID=A0A0Q3GK59_BRADI|nr:hypothetical protein BRADI_2g60537v3 [Brachypodium distachyon]